MTRLLALCALAITVGCGGQETTTVRIAAGTPGGTTRDIASRLKQLLDRTDSDHVFEVSETDGDLDILQRLRGGEAELGIVGGHALSQLPTHERDRVRILAPLYPNYLQVVVPFEHRDERIDWLRNKRIFLGAPMSGTRAMALELIEHHGISPYQEYNATSFNDAADALINAAQLRRASRANEQRTAPGDDAAGSAGKGRGETDEKGIATPATSGSDESGEGGEPAKREGDAAPGDEAEEASADTPPTPEKKPGDKPAAGKSGNGKPAAGDGADAPGKPGKDKTPPSKPAAASDSQPAGPPGDAKTDEFLSTYLETLPEAGIFYAGTPTKAVDRLLKAKSAGGDPLFALLSVELPTPQEKLIDPAVIPGSTYGRETDVTSIQSYTYLVCQRDLKPALGAMILEELFDHVESLAGANRSALNISWHQLTEAPPDGFSFHDGRDTFLEAESERLIIATGPIGGSYYRVGATVKRLLEREGISARVVHTNGSYENVNLVRKGNCIALMKYDAALAQHWGSWEFVYNYQPKDSPPDKYDELRVVAALFPEPIHVLHRDAGEVADAADNEASQTPLMMIGPPQSGNDTLARAVLHHWGLYAAADSAVASHYKKVNMSYDDMMDQFNDTSIQVQLNGIIATQIDSEDISGALHRGTATLDPSATPQTNSTKFVSLPRIALRQLLRSPAIEAFTIPGNTYPIQPGYGTEDQSEAIHTLATRALLVTSASLHKRFSMEKISKAIYENHSSIYKEADEESMATFVDSIPLHEETVTYLRERSILPKEVTWIEKWAEFMMKYWPWFAYLATTILGVKYFLPYRRLMRRTMRTPVDDDPEAAVELLHKVHDDARWCAGRFVFQFSYITAAQFSTIHGALTAQIESARERIVFILLVDVDAAMQNIEDEDELQMWRGEMTNKLREFVREGKLDHGQFSTLLGRLHDEE
jgi:TRAP transporter TAXI family solute receptor